MREITQSLRRSAKNTPFRTISVQSRCGKKKHVEEEKMIPSKAPQTHPLLSLSLAPANDVDELRSIHFFDALLLPRVKEIHRPFRPRPIRERATSHGRTSQPITKREGPRGPARSDSGF